MRIVFTSTWQKTDLFALLAKRLEKHGIQSAWIVTSDAYRRSLIAKGFGRETILHLRKDVAQKSRSYELDLEKMRGLERATNEAVKNFVRMDRYVSDWPWPKAERYAAYVTARTADFLDSMAADIVVGEPSVLHDLLAVMVCEATGRQYFAPMMLRLPVQRLAFWHGYLEKEFLTRHARIPAEVSPEFLDMARDMHSQIVVDRRRPSYFYKNRNAPKITPELIFKMGRGVGRAIVQSRTDANMYTLKHMLAKNKLHMRPLHYASAKLRWQSIFEEARADERFVLFTLNRQPEYSVDVLGSRHSNQYETIRAIALELPADVRLYVKEHSACLGDRSPGELKRIKALPGVRLIDPFADTHELIKRSDAVVTICGTIALEAALYGKRALVLADHYLAGFSTSKHIDAAWQVAEELSKPLPKQDFDYDMQYLGWLLENSFEGILTDPVSSPECVTGENLDLIEQAFLELAKARQPAHVEAREATS